MAEKLDRRLATAVLRLAVRNLHGHPPTSIRVRMCIPISDRRPGGLRRIYSLFNQLLGSQLGRHDQPVANSVPNTQPAQPQDSPTL
jgi:hypothetical protein